MAEQVQAILERMVPHLKDLRDRGLFTPAEIRAVVDRRRRSEYLLQRRAAARRSDYLRYIEEEVLLERLRKLRKQKVLAAMRHERENRGGGASDDDDEDGDGGDGRPKKKRRKGRKHAYQATGPGDAHVVAHIHFLYQRTLRKFHYPLDVLLSYAEFAKKHKSFQVLGRIYAEGLQHHPRESGLWIEAASFEYFGYVAQDYEKGKKEDEVHTKVVGSSIRNARVLLQRGLRINQTNEELWLQYFALELHYVQKLHGRKMILEDGNGDGDNDDDDDDDDDDVDDDSHCSKDVGDAGKGMPAPLVPSRIIFDNAIKAVPSDVRFRLRFVEVCRLFPRTEQLTEHVMASVALDFGMSIPGWVARIAYAEDRCRQKATASEEPTRKPIGFLGAAEDAGKGENGTEGYPKKSRLDANPDEGDEASDLRLLREALAAVPTAAMYLEGAQFLRARIQRLLNHNSGAAQDEEEGEAVTHLIEKGEDAQGAARRHARLLEELYASADEKTISSINLTLDRAEYLLSVGQPKQAEELLSTAVATPPPANSHGQALLWLRWAELARQRAAGGTAAEGAAPPPSSPAHILRRALKRTPIHARQSHALILAALMRQLMAQPASPKNRDELERLFQKLTLLSQGADNRASAEEFDHDGQDNPAATFVAYLKYMMRHGTENCVRSVYAGVLRRSNYGTSCASKTEEERRAMKVFFDICLRFEQAGGSKGGAADQEKNVRDGKDKKRAQKRCLRELYEAAIRFYEGGDSTWRNVADQYGKDLHDLKYSF